MQQQQQRLNKMKQFISWIRTDKETFLLDQKINHMDTIPLNGGMIEVDFEVTELTGCDCSRGDDGDYYLETELDWDRGLYLDWENQLIEEWIRSDEKEEFDTQLEKDRRQEWEENQWP